MTFDDNTHMKGAGRWAGFCFVDGRFVTPEGHEFHPEDMVWWSLTCNIAQEWKRMMAEASQEAREKRVLREKVVPLRRRLAERRRLATQRVQRG